MKRLRIAGLVLMLLAVGVAIPVSVLVLNAGPESRKAPDGVELTASQEHGRQLFARNCATCHTLAAANAVGKVGYDLDQHLGPLTHDAVVSLVLNAIANGRAEGKGQMPKNLLQGSDASDVAAFLSRTAGRS